jgi:hypothetical protein
MLIVAESARLLREDGSRETPQEHSDEEAPEPPVESERLELKSTDLFNRT